KTCFAKSNPIVVTSPMDGSHRCRFDQTAVWHSDAARGPSTPSLDHLVGEREHARRDFEAERLGRLEVYATSRHMQCSKLEAIRPTRRGGPAALGYAAWSLDRTNTAPA